ncbi:hypothetical protein [Aliidiomarina celeris]|uniref:hypothetical protein n=1 Tax=Aliidiomarina celeris TaxID=2249428 RepID=UPI000DEA922F|nr:hypothetical protein [Aliidiomarina celeris]
MAISKSLKSVLFAFATLFTATACSAVATTQADTEHSERQKVLVTITSESSQTQGMALVLSGQMLAQGADLTILLCNEGGYIAVAGHQGESLKPFNLTPSQQLAGLIERGANVQLCALFLPNNEVSPEQILPGVVGRAQPPEIARMMLSPEVRVFTF